MRLRKLTPFLWLILASPAFGQEKTRILFIGTEPDHPHASHMYAHTCGVLAKCVEKTPGVEAVVSRGWPQDPKTLEGVKAIVVYSSPGAELLVGGKDREQAIATLDKGVGLVTIHWSSCVKKENLDRLGPTWLKYVGGTWISNVGISNSKSVLKTKLPDHPIHRGWKEYEIDDEFYLNPKIEKAQPFLEIRDRGKDVVVAWVYDRPDKGRTFCTTLGHHYRNFQMEPFRKMIVNGALWAAHVDVPAAGAPVDVGDDVLALPPAPPKKK